MGLFNRMKNSHWKLCIESLKKICSLPNWSQEIQRMVVEITVTQLLITLKNMQQHLLSTKIPASMFRISFSKLKNRTQKLVLQVFFLIILLSIPLVRFINIALVLERQRFSSKPRVRLTKRFRDAGEIEEEPTKVDDSGSSKKSKLVWSFLIYATLSSCISDVANLLNTIENRQGRTDAKLVFCWTYICALRSI